MEKEAGEIKLLSNHYDDVQDEGGETRILAYEITVFLGSIPFITFLTWRAGVMGLNKRSALLITVYLCGDVMLFPWALRFGWINWWVLSIIVLFVGIILWPKVLIKNRTKDNIIASEINGYAEKNSNEEIIEQTQANTVEMIEMIEIVEIVEMVETESLVNTEEIIMISIDELIDLGFKEKHADNLEQAASYFSQALSQDPIPDLAFSLIIDCYWLWNNLGKRGYALAQLQTYFQKYLPLFNTELRVQFDTWMAKEDIQIILE
ncbi:MAG: hypothetical protein WA125_11095 [Desulfosporosinus sp.]